MARVSGLFSCAHSPGAETPALARRFVRVVFAYAAATAATVSCGGGSNGASDDGGADSAPSSGASDDGGADSALSSCRPTTCTALGAECGVVSDGCGTILQCGVCASPRVCGQFARNRCGCPSGDCDAGSTADAGAAADTGGPAVITVDAGMAVVRTIVLRNNDLVLDPVRTRLYVTVPGTEPAMGNQVVTIDPAAASITASLFVGSQPHALAISDDSNTLYVGIDTASSVVAVNLVSGTVGPDVSLGTPNAPKPNALGTNVAGEIRAVPNSPTQYLVSMLNTCCLQFSGLSLFDGPTLLGTSTAAISGGSIAFASASSFFSVSNVSNTFDLYRFTVGAPAGIDGGLDGGAGVMTLSTYRQGFANGFVGSDIAVQGGWIFTSFGDAVSADTLRLLGYYNTMGPVLPDIDGTDVWFLATPTATQPITPALVDYDRTTFVQRKSVPLPGLPLGGNTYATATSLVRWSTTGFAFRTDLGVFIVNLLP